MIGIDAGCGDNDCLGNEWTSYSAPPTYENIRLAGIKAKDRVGVSDVRERMYRIAGVRKISEVDRAFYPALLHEFERLAREAPCPQHLPEIINMPTPTDLCIGPEVTPWPPLRMAPLGEPARPATVIDEAAGIIHGARQSPHGRPERSFDAIAALWNGYLGALADKAGATFLPIKPHQVADMMELLKIARAAAGDPGHRDHYVDRIGYAALAHELVQRPE